MLKTNLVPFVRLSVTIIRFFRDGLVGKKDTRYYPLSKWLLL